MADRPPIPDLLDRLVLIAQSVMDSREPSHDDGSCPLCALTDEHDPDCGWVQARKLASSDLSALGRLARALRYGPDGN